MIISASIRISTRVSFSFSVGMIVSIMIITTISMTTIIIIIGQFSSTRYSTVINKQSNDNKEYTTYQNK